MITTSRIFDPSFTFMAHVVQPLVWPGVRCAFSTVPPSFTSSPSCSTRATCAGGIVVPVRVTDQQDLHVAQLETERFNTRAQVRNAGLDVAVYQDVALRGRDEVTRDAFSPDVIK